MINSYFLKQKELVKQLEKSFSSGNHQSTVVEMQKDYANDDQICLTSLVFIPDNISGKIISDCLSRLKSIEPNHYFYPPESLHLTIKNIHTVTQLVETTIIAEKPLAARRILRLLQQHSLMVVYAQ